MARRRGRLGDRKSVGRKEQPCRPASRDLGQNDLKIMRRPIRSDPERSSKERCRRGKTTYSEGVNVGALFPVASISR